VSDDKTHDKLHDDFNLKLAKLLDLSPLNDACLFTCLSRATALAAAHAQIDVMSFVQITAQDFVDAKNVVAIEETVVETVHKTDKEHTH